MLTSDQNRKINEIVEEFKEAADFYRMEYSEDLMGMFRDFGCMLLLKCKVDTEGKADLERLLEGRHKLKGTVKRQLMTVSEELAQLWAPGNMKVPKMFGKCFRRLLKRSFISAFTAKAVKTGISFRKKQQSRFFVCSHFRKG